MKDLWNRRDRGYIVHEKIHPHHEAHEEKIRNSNCEIRNVWPCLPVCRCGELKAADRLDVRRGRGKAGFHGVD